MKTQFFLNYQLPVVLGAVSKELFTTQLIQYTNHLVNYHNPRLTIKKNEILLHPKNIQWLYVITITTSNVNHPYVVFTDLTSNIMSLLIPYGNESKQAPMQDIPKLIPLCTPIEKYALYLSIVKSIDLRKYAILESDQYNLLKCDNITNCIKKINEIKSLNISKNDKEILIKRAQVDYTVKAVEFLRKFFNLLTAQDYTEARDFLKGDKGKYFGKQRLNTFFKNSKAIIGHLQIFIPLYQYGAILSKELVV